MRTFFTLVLLLSFVYVSLSYDGPSIYPIEMRNMWTFSSCFDVNHTESLIDSSDMIDRIGSVVVAIPFHLLTNVFFIPATWPLFNSDITSINMNSFEECSIFDGTFNTAINVTIPDGYHFADGFINLVNITKKEAILGWEFKVCSDDDCAVNLAWGSHHHYFKAIEVNGRQATWYTTWEKYYDGGDGSGFVSSQSSQYQFGMNRDVLQPDWVGIACLERVYDSTGALFVEDIDAQCHAVCPH